jgi:hypothetical protein
MDKIMRINVESMFSFILKTQYGALRNIENSVDPDQSPNSIVTTGQGVPYLNDKFLIIVMTKEWLDSINLCCFEN